jgi:hypothetical protein
MKDYRDLCIEDAVSVSRDLEDSLRGRRIGLLTILFSGAAGLLELRAVPSKTQLFCDTSDQQAVRQFAGAHRHEHVYFGVATRSDDSSGTLENCRELPALFVDIDFGRDEAAARDRLANGPLPPTAVVESGNGLHAYWKLREPMDPTASKPILRRLAIYFGADLSAAEGARVLRLPNTLNHKTVPPRPVLLISLDETRQYNQSDFDGWLPMEPESRSGAVVPFSVPATIATGSRNELLYRTCRSLIARGLSEAAIHAAIREENASRCSPPLDELEVSEILRKALRQPDRPGFERRPIEPSADGSDTTDPRAWRLLDDVALLGLPEPSWLIENVLQERTLGVLYAPPGAGKTTIVASLTVALARRPEWCGHRVVAPTRSIYVGAEDPSGFKVRLAAEKRSRRLDLDEAIGVFTFPEAVDLRDPLNVTAFAKFIESQFPDDGKPGLLVIDTYAASTPGAVENSFEDTSTAVKHAQYLRDTLGCAVLLVHHTNAGGSRERGHSALRGSADTMIAVTPVDDLILVDVDKQRNGATGTRLATLKIVPEPGGGCVVRPDGEVPPSKELTSAQRKAYEVLRETFGVDGATKGDWLKTTTGVAERTFYRASKVLVERGYVIEVGNRFRVTTAVPE